MLRCPTVSRETCRGTEWVVFAGVSKGRCGTVSGNAAGFAGGTDCPMALPRPILDAEGRHAYLYYVVSPLSFG